MIHDLDSERNISENVFLPLSISMSVFKHNPLTKEKLSFSGKRNCQSCWIYSMILLQSSSKESHGSEVFALKKDKHLTVMRIDEFRIQAV